MGSNMADFEQTEPDILMLIYDEVLSHGHRLEHIEVQLRTIQLDMNGMIYALRGFGQRLGLLEDGFVPHPTPVPTPDKDNGNGDDHGTTSET